MAQLLDPHSRLWLGLVGRRRRWTGPPARPIRYGPIARLTDVYHGLRDGRAGVPRLPTGADGASTAGDVDVATEHVVTAHLEVLRRRTREQIVQEQVVAQAEIAALVDCAVPEAVGRVRTVVQQLSEAVRRYEAAIRQPTEHQLTERRLAEDRHKRPDGLVAARRLAEHRQRELRATEELRQVVRQLELARTELAAAKAGIELRMAVARSRAQRIHEHGWRRCAAYWQQLVRSHGDGGRLNGLLELAGPDLPEWAREQPPTESGHGPDRPPEDLR